ncbi:hypothetical protein [Longirhabdus pacifica]|nr:hypothetical protein [Longirhabdus pacifica]
MGYIVEQTSYNTLTAFLPITMVIFIIVFVLFMVNIIVRIMKTKK